MSKAKKIGKAGGRTFEFLCGPLFALTAKGGALDAVPSSVRCAHILYSNSNSHITIDIC